MSGSGKRRRLVFGVWIMAGLLLLQPIFLAVRRPVSSGLSGVRSGELVLVERWSYGCRLPITPLSLPFFPGLYVSGLKLPYFRLPGFQDPKAGDAVAFNLPPENDPPVDKKTFSISRIVAIPGDTIWVDGGMAKRGSLPESPNPKTRFLYRVVATEPNFNPEEILRSFPELKRLAGLAIWDGALNPAEALDLRARPGIQDVRRLSMKELYPYNPIFPHSPFYPWSKDGFGPIIVPTKGQTIEFDSVSFVLYRRMIEDYEGNQVEVRDDGIYINQIRSDYYTFRQNYYFVLDDLRDEGYDSRYWGFLPEDHLIGKLLFPGESVGSFYSID